MPVADPLIGAPIYTDYPTTTPMVGTTGMALEPGGIAPAYTDYATTTPVGGTTGGAL